MVIINNNIIKNKSSSYTSNNYYYYKNNLINIINNTNYCNILYLMKDKGFTYHREIKTILGINGVDYLNNLLEKYDLIVPYTLNKSERKILLNTRTNFNNKHLKMMKFYSLRKEVLELLQNDFIIDIFENRITDKVKESKINLFNIYNEKVDYENKQIQQIEKIMRLKQQNGIR